MTLTPCTGAGGDPGVGSMSVPFNDPSLCMADSMASFFIDITHLEGKTTSQSTRRISKFRNSFDILMTVVCVPKVKHVNLLLLMYYVYVYYVILSYIQG